MPQDDQIFGLPNRCVVMCRGMQLCLGYSSVISIRNEQDSLDWINSRQPWKANQAQTCNAEVCVKDIHHVSWSVRNPAFP